jgi:biopolymer transport protein ExbD
MAGGGGGEASADNPLPLNVVPLIDVIFCLLLFFMCSFHFKTLEGKMEAWLPQDKGMSNAKPQTDILGEIRVVLEWDKANNRVVRRFGRTEYPNDEDLGELMRKQSDMAKGNGKGDIPVIIQPDGEVPWDEVIRVMDITRQKGLQKMEFNLARSEFKIPDRGEHQTR